MKTTGFHRGLVEAPQPRPPGCLVMPGDIFMSQLGRGWRMGGAQHPSAHRTASTTKNCRAQSVRGPKAERPCYELGSLKRSPLRFLNRRDPARDKTNSAA